VIIARVLGNVVATAKLEKLEGVKLLLVQAHKLDGRSLGKPFVAIDNVGAGAGERVLVVREGKSAMQMLGKGLATVDAAVVGIIDHYEYDGRRVDCQALS